jgi:DNA (cytosine-5)-methyltransferase 1
MQKTDSAATSQKQLTFGSLFAGIGGFDLGFERAGMVCKWQVEIDDYATKILKKHWPNVHRERDVRTVGRDNLEQVDIVCGGFPCQDISKARQGERRGIDGEKSGLWGEFRRIVSVLRPRFVVMENSAELIIRGLNRIAGEMVELGYDSEWKIHAACDAGAKHIRERCYVLSYPIGFGDRLEKKTICSGWEKPEHSSWWDSESGVGRVADGVSSRVDRLRCLGNAVVPQVAEWIGRRIVESISNQQR